MEDLLKQLKKSESEHERKIAYDRLLHYYKENEALYYRTMRKDEDQQSEAQKDFMARMERIREQLEL